MCADCVCVEFVWEITNAVSVRGFSDFKSLSCIARTASAFASSIGTAATESCFWASTSFVAAAR